MSTANQNLSNINRRHLLKSLGIAAFASASIPALAFEKEAMPKFKNITVKYAATVADLIEDKGWKENDVVRTTGYHKVSDGGHAEYLIQKEPLALEGSLTLKNGLSAALINVSVVNYQMFGAVKDGQNDDGVQIKAAHQFANQNNIPVVNPLGEYWIKNTHGIKILNNVDWGNSIFHIDEKFNNPKASRFEVSSKQKEKAITLTAEEKASFIKKFKPGVSLISELAPYNNCLVIVVDNKDKIGFRSGARFVGQSWSREDLFYVEEHGRIIGDLAWEFKDYSSLVAIPVSDTYLIINGGGFYLSGDSNGKGYTRNGFSITRSRTHIQNQWVGLEPGNVDSAPNARNGFYSFSKVYDVMLENVRLIPYEQDRVGTANDVPAGTYGISAGRMMNGTFRNVTAEGGLVHWGVFGTNLNKNFKIDNSKLNRVDVHFHCWNLHIKDSLIGQRGISITGGGNLVIENTRCEASSFVNFRRDFGAKWDGDITIRNCIFKPSSLRDTSILNFNPEDFDYKYPVVLGRSINIEQLLIDYTGSENKAPCWMVFFPSFSRLKHGDRISFPAIINIRHVRTAGRVAGVRLLKINDPQLLNLSQKGAYDSIQLQSNGKFIFENIQLENLAETGLSTQQDVHIQFNQRAKSTPSDHFSLFSDIKFVDCKGISADFTTNTGNVGFYNCSVVKVVGKKDGEMPGKLSFSHCSFEPTAMAPEHIVLDVASELGTSFTNCTLHSPKIKGAYKPERLDRITFVQVNKEVKYNHLNTLLGRDILNYYKLKKVALNPKFISMLKSHHELESSNVV